MTFLVKIMTKKGQKLENYAFLVIIIDKRKLSDYNSKKS